jgi:hypothetical protein
MSGNRGYFWAINKMIIMEPSQDKKFIPKGAMAFFIFLVLLSLAFWYGIYALMIDRT